MIELFVFDRNNWNHLTMYIGTLDYFEIVTISVAVSISLYLSVCLHSFLSSIALDRSSRLHPVSQQSCVTYWPSTEPSIKRCTCVNKRKNSGSRWTLNKNITRTQTAWVSWRQDAGVKASGRQRACDPQWPMVEQPQPRWGRSAAMVRRTWGQYSSLSPSPAHRSHTRNITLSKIKCGRYIFIKKCVRSFIEVRHYCWLCFRLCNLKQVLAATPHKTPTVRPPAPYYENYSS